MGRSRAEGDWTNPQRPPIPDAIDLGDNVWASWASEYNGGEHVLIWHWCDRTVAIANDKRDGITDRQQWWYEPRWVPAGGAGHDLIARDPLHLEPSLLWPDCCGKHGFVRDGRWVPA